MSERVVEERGRPRSWVEVTRDWIDRWQVVDSAGTRHAPHGIWTSAARLTVYVLFDNNPRIGQRAHYLFTADLKRWALSQSNNKPLMATLDSRVRVSNTGAGYLASLTESGLFIDRVEWIGEQPADDPDLAVRLVIEQLRARDFRGYRLAKIQDQLRGIDIFVGDPISRYGVDPVPLEVKSRTKRQTQDRIFVQISETNPEHRT